MPLPSRKATAKLARKLHKKGAALAATALSNFRDKTNVRLKRVLDVYFFNFSLFQIKQIKLKQNFLHRFKPSIIRTPFTTILDYNIYKHCIYSKSILSKYNKLFWKPNSILFSKSETCETLIFDTRITFFIISIKY